MERSAKKGPLEANKTRNAIESAHRRTVKHQLPLRPADPVLVPGFARMPMAYCHLGVRLMASDLLSVESPSNCVPKLSQHPYSTHLPVLDTTSCAENISFPAFAFPPFSALPGTPGTLVRHTFQAVLSTFQLFYPLAHPIPYIKGLQLTIARWHCPGLDHAARGAIVSIVWVAECVNVTRRGAAIQGVGLGLLDSCRVAGCRSSNAAA